MNVSPFHAMFSRLCVNISLPLVLMHWSLFRHMLSCMTIHVYSYIRIELSWQNGIINLIPTYNKSAAVDFENSYNTDEIPYNTDAMTYNTDIIPYNTDYMTYNTDDIPYNTDKIPYYTEWMPCYTDEIPCKTKKNTYMGFFVHR